MKPNSQLLVFTGLLPALLLGQALSQDSPAPESTAPPLSKLLIEPEDILSSKTEVLGGRQITIQRVAPIALPSAPEPAPPPDPLSPEVQQRLQEFRAKYSDTTMVSIGATVFRSASLADGPRTLIQVWDRETKTSFKLWSSVNWTLLAGIGEVQGTDGQKYALMMNHSEVDLDGWAQLMAAHGQEYVAPAIPPLPTRQATFIVAEGAPTAAALAPITALHQLYNTDHARLQAAHDARQQERRDQEQALRENPPQPKNIVIRHWRMDEAGRQGITPKPAVTR